jgi:hypothetical protein
MPKANCHLANRVEVGETSHPHRFLTRRFLKLDGFKPSSLAAGLAVRFVKLALVFYFQKQHRHIYRVPHFVHRRAVEDVADETMAMCGHGDQINILFAGQFNDFV